MAYWPCWWVVAGPNFGPINRRYIEVTDPAKIFDERVRKHLSYEAEQVHASYLLHQLEEEYSPEMDRLVAVARTAADLYAEARVREATTKFCKRGHLRTPDNVGSKRQCKACDALYHKQYRARTALTQAKEKTDHE